MIWPGAKNFEAYCGLERVHTREEAETFVDLAIAYLEMGLFCDALLNAALGIVEGGDTCPRAAVDVLFHRELRADDYLPRIRLALSCQIGTVAGRFGNKGR